MVIELDGAGEPASGSWQMRRTAAGGALAMEILRLRGLRILDTEFHALLEAVCGLRGKGGVFMACAKNPGVGDKQPEVDIPVPSERMAS